MIDIIVPVYNSKDTLDNMFLSVINQVNVPKIKLYLIDDCSTEDYSSIIQKYKPKIDVVYEKLDSNKGPGYARKRGIEISSSKYIIFLDSDDVFYDKDSVSKLYNAIEENNSDVVRSVIHEECGNEIRVYENENIGLHGKIYRRGFLEEKDITFNNEKSNEDTGFNLLINLCGANYTDISDVTYLWKDNKKSITRKNKDEYQDIHNEKNAYNICWAFEEAVNRAYDMERYKYFSLLNLMELYITSKNITNKKVVDKINTYISKIYDLFVGVYNGFIMNLFYDYELVEYYGIENIYEMLKSMPDKKIDLRREFMPLYSDEEYNDRFCHLQLMKDYNNTPLGNYELVNKMFASIGESTQVVPPFNANWGGKNIHIGSNCFINYNFSAVDDGDIYIGNDTLLAPGVQILTVSHPVDPTERLHKKMYISSVIIKENVWIGAGSIIFPGVTIGKNSVIGAGSIVTKDIPDNVLAYGNPCKVIKKI